MNRVLALVALCVLVFPTGLVANDFDLVLKATCGDQSVKAEPTRETMPPRISRFGRPGESTFGRPRDSTIPTKTVEPKPDRRPSLSMLPGQTAHVSWQAKNSSKSDPFKDVIVHFFVVHEEKLGQAEVPKVKENAVYEGALTTDFEPQETANWDFDLKIDAAGSYMLRVETVGMQESHGHDHYAVLDLSVENQAQ